MFSEQWASIYYQIQNNNQTLTKKGTICELGMCLSTLPVHTEPRVQLPASNNSNMACYSYHTLAFGKLRQEDQEFIVACADITKHRKATVDLGLKNIK